MTEENRALGTPLGKHPTRVLFLGSGELGKEVTLELMRLGAWVCAADSYEGAPAQQVAHEYRALDMANAEQLRVLFDEIQPDIIVPEIEAIATSELAAAAERGAQVVPSAEIASICMDRERLRVLAHEELGLPTTPYRFAGSLEELRAGAKTVGYPCVVKPIMSSSGHGQSVVRSADAIDAAWVEAQEGRRAHDEGDVSRVIVEALAPLDYELTVLTVSSSAGIVTCAPIGQRQESGDYRESWQPASFTQDVLAQAQRIACTAVEGLVAKAKFRREGWGVFGVELFVLTDGSVLFNEVSPRPHDTGMVTMASQRLSEFALHARAILGLPITQEHVALSIPDGAVAASHAIVIQAMVRPNSVTSPTLCLSRAPICVFSRSRKCTAIVAWRSRWPSEQMRPTRVLKPRMWPNRSKSTSPDALLPDTDGRLPERAQKPFDCSLPLVSC